MTTVSEMEAAKTKKKQRVQEPEALINYPPKRPDLPTYTAEQIAEHCDEESMWYSFRGGVYDLTGFLQGHPGGAPVSTTVQVIEQSSFLSFCQLTYSLAVVNGGWTRFGTVLENLPTGMQN